MENNTLMTDLYELTMAQTYFKSNAENEIVCFDLFFRKNPFKGGYTISAGLDSIIDYIKNIKITNEDIEYLKSLNKFDDDFLEYLKDFKFTGNMYAIPDGTPVFPNEPVITVTANVIEAQLIETALLASFNGASLVATVAKRITEEAQDIPVMEFGARRAPGIAGANEVTKYAYLGGCIGTSNVKGAQLYNIPPLGTMAHSLILKYDNEYDAFLNYAKTNPNNCLFLVDTYDTLRSGIPNAIRVAKEYLIPNNYKFLGVRIDSGDLAYLSKEARKMLDDAGFSNATLCLSNSLNEFTIRDLKAQGAYVDSLGVGDNIAHPNDRVGGVYKLSAVKKDNDFIPKLKVSNDIIKITNPGYKKLYRFYDKETGYALGDVMALHDEIIDKHKYTLINPNEEWKRKTITNYIVRELQVPIFENGKLIYKEPTLKEKREYCLNEMKTLYEEVKRLLNPHEYYVDLSEKLLELKKNLILQSKENNIEENGIQFRKGGYR